MGQWPHLSPTTQGVATAPVATADSDRVRDRNRQPRLVPEPGSGRCAGVARTEHQLQGDGSTDGPRAHNPRSAIQGNGGTVVLEVAITRDREGGRLFGILPMMVREPLHGPLGPHDAGSAPMGRQRTPPYSKLDQTHGLPQPTISGVHAHRHCVMTADTQIRRTPEPVRRDARPRRGRAQ